MKLKRFGVWTLMFAMPISSKAVFASDKEQVVAAIHQFADNLDAKTMDKALVACDSSTAIIDEFPPHVWSSCADWFKDFGEYNEKNGITPGSAPIGVPWSVDVNGDRAYVVAPATYSFTQHGKATKELHSVFTAALRKTDGGWKIMAWTWSKH